jgi:hypothetical protein
MVINTPPSSSISSSSITRSGGRSKPKTYRGSRTSSRCRGLKCLKGRKGPIAKGSSRGHTVKFEHCVKSVKRSNSLPWRKKVNPYAVCVNSVGW